MGGVVAVLLVAGLVSGGAAYAAAPPYQDLARRLVGADQGVYARAEDGTVLAAVEMDRAVHPASVSKIPTTLALLRRLGPAHRFETRIVGTGPIANGTLAGDLVVEASSDPFIVSEHAFWMAAELHELGVRQVAGRLRVEGPLLFNWRPDPDGAGLRAVLTGAAGHDAWSAARAGRPGLGERPPRLRFLDKTVPRGAARETLLVHRSPPLVRIVKAFNGYSNNVFHPLSDVIGGPAAVQKIAVESVPAAARSGIRLDNAAGAGTTNRLSPRAAVELIAALERELAKHGLTLADVLPVAGVDAGTLRERLDDPATRGTVVGKTGTYGDVGACALAGVVYTERWGRVTFAILDRGVPVPEARSRQDAFVRALVADAGGRALAYTPDPLPAIMGATLAVGR
ncbi:MAG TPA: D-alanyl-D-alanine carboxypeptidase [Candidatus Limnocylindria bacterium]|nr:D-alanyl-D-alanine carboxypeptidase [Candidatus Limnocylindria bacterium]